MCGGGCAQASASKDSVARMGNPCTSGTGGTPIISRHARGAHRRNLSRLGTASLRSPPAGLRSPPPPSATRATCFSPARATGRYLYSVRAECLVRRLSAPSPKSARHLHLPHTRRSATPTCRYRETLSGDEPLLRPGLPSELFLNRLRHEVHEGGVVRHTVELEAPVKLFRDAGRQLRPHLLDLHHLCRLLLRPRWTPWTMPTPATTVNGLRLRG